MRVTARAFYDILDTNTNAKRAAATIELNEISQLNATSPEWKASIDMDEQSSDARPGRVSSYVMGLDFLDDSLAGVDYENALISAGFGKFHYMLLALCGLIYLNTAVGITIISFVLPSATCDFQMTSTDKGWLTAAPMLGEYY